MQTEFGADMWTFVLAAGFRAVTVHAVSFPDAIAISAVKPVAAEAVGHPISRRRRLVERLMPRRDG